MSSLVGSVLSRVDLGRAQFKLSRGSSQAEFSYHHVQLSCVRPKSSRVQ